MTPLELAEKYVMSTNVSVFLTGKAGTGKTTFLKRIVSSVKKRNVVLAPTGVAAVNAAGVTIHSFFQLPFCPYLPDVKELVTEYQMPEKFKSLRREKIKILRTLDLIIIDEISMVRADLLDAIDMTLRRYRRSGKPFGGVQLLMIGDVQQLPPVVTESERPYLEQVYPSPFFFHSKALKNLPYITIELKTIFRQQDETFIGILNSIRDNKLDSNTLKVLNSHYRAKFDPPDSEGYIRLTTHNYQSDSVNRRKMDALPSRPFELKAEIDGNFPQWSYPTDANLTLKKGAQVMFVKNDSQGHAYYNGKLATVEGFDPKEGVAVVDRDGNHIIVSQERWENIRYDIDPNDNQIKQIVDGSFVQYPLKPAWAITVHKSQGLTFDRVIVDAAAAFTYGQVYVALSRCRSLVGLVLVSPISERCVFDNDDVLQFNNSFPSEEAVEQGLSQSQTSYFFDMVFELFDMSVVSRVVERIVRLFREQVKGIPPSLATKITAIENQAINMTSVVEKFRKQLININITTGGDTEDSNLHDRINKGVLYFEEQFQQLMVVAAPLLELESKNKVVAKTLKELTEDFNDAVGLKQRCLGRVKEEGFSIQVYNKAKVDFTLEKENNPSGRKGSRGKQSSSKAKEPAKPKEPTWVESARLFSEGNSIEAIAALKGKAVSTIAGHIQTALEAGAIDVDMILTSDEFDELLQYIIEDHPQTATEVFQHFQGRYPYYKIRAALFSSKGMV